MDSKHWDDVKCKKYGFPRRVYSLFALNGGHLGFIMQVTRPLGTSQQSRFIISMPMPGTQVKPKTWRISAFADARLTPLVLNPHGIYHWSGSR